MTFAFAQLVEAKDDETGDHIKRVTEYATIIAKGLQENHLPDYEINRNFINDIERNTSSHDIGKIGIPDNILNKPGKLTEEEFEIMKSHSELGYKVFNELGEGLRIFERDYYKTASEIARSHHEKWDGSGYPEGLIGKDIPISARIVAIADVFDALSSARVYKKAFSFEKSVKIIKESSGNHFDPYLVEIFMKKIDSIKQIYNNYFGLK